MARTRKREGEREKRRLETIAAAIGAIIALGTVGLIVVDAVVGAGGQPAIVVKSLDVEEQAGGFLLEISVANEGGSPASEVAVEGTLSRDGEVLETSGATFDYVAKGSRRRGGLLFSEDPREFDLAVRATGYVKP